MGDSSPKIVQNTRKRKPDRQTQASITYMGVSLNGGTPKTPQNDHF